MGGNVFKGVKFKRDWKCPGCENPNEPPPRIWHEECFRKAFPNADLESLTDSIGNPRG